MNEFNVAPKQIEANRLGTRLEKFWQNEKSSKSPSLVRALFRMLGMEFIIYGVTYFLIDMVVTVLQPLSFAKLLDAFSSQQDIVCYGVIIITLSFLRVLTGNFLQMQMAFLGTKIRVACCSLIYQKVLTLKKSTLQKISFGNIVNLLTSDVERFDRSFSFLHFLWIFPIKIFLVGIFIYFKFGLSASSGISVIIGNLILQICCGKVFLSLRKTAASKTDNRISLINNIVCGIQAIKMYTWEKPFKALVDSSRNAELTEMLKINNFFIVLAFPLTILSHLCIFVCILVAVLCNSDLQPSYIFALTNLYDLLNNTGDICAGGVSYLSNVLVTLRRMQQLLLAENEELNTYFKTNEKNLCGVRLDKVGTKWSSSSDKNVLSSVTFNADRSETVAVVGSPGSGKSTLLQVILKDLDVIKGDVFVGGTISYAPQEPWIFAATIRQNILFGEAMNEKRYDKVIRMCALDHDLIQLSHGDSTLVGERGVKLSGGQKSRINLARAVYRNADIYLLDDPLSAVDGHVASHIFNKCIQEYLKNKCVVLVTHQVQYLANVDRIYVLQNGKVAASGKYEDIENLVGKAVEKCAKKDIEAVVTKRRKCELPPEVEENACTGTNPYKTYLWSEDRWMMTSLYLLVFILMQFILNGSSYFLSFWVNEKQKLPLLYSSKDLNFLSIYSGLIVALIIICYSALKIFFLSTTRTSRIFHDNLLSKVLFGPMKFFNDHSSGRILTRFSRDIGIIDEVIPRNFINLFRAFFKAIGATILISILNLWMTIPTIVLYLFSYFFTLSTMSTMRCIKDIEKIRLSPISTHVSASLQGFSIIRAFKKQNLLQTEFDNHQDLYSSAYYLHEAMHFARAFWIELICGIYSAVVIIFVLVFHNVMSLGDFGLTVTQSMATVTTIQWGLKTWSLLDPSMSSVERVAEYMDLTREEDDGKFAPAESWPEKGKIIFDSVSVKYSSEQTLVLDKVSFTVKPGEKIGIVGRTGAGKSSLISCLFRLFDFDGKIHIDDVDIKTISLNALRSKMTIIPQDPVLFIGTLRKNIDPFSEFTDSQLWSALEDVELKTYVSGLSSGLDSEISEGGSNVSVGQKQLLCLVRAILKNSKIIVLDEATANVDLKTDELIQSTLRRRFKDSTVLTIAHRLETVLDSDKILVMENGRVADFDNTEELLKKSDGYLAQFCEKF